MSSVVERSTLGTGPRAKRDPIAGKTVTLAPSDDGRPILPAREILSGAGELDVRAERADRTHPRAEGGRFHDDYREAMRARTLIAITARMIAMILATTSSSKIEELRKREMRERIIVAT